jgi:hypothetical protein
LITGHSVNPIFSQNQFLCKKFTPIKFRIKHRLVYGNFRRACAEKKPGGKTGLIKRFAFFPLFVILMTACGNYADNLKGIIEYKYDFSNLTRAGLHSIFESLGYKPVGSMPSWNKKIGNILFSAEENINAREIII